MQLCNLTFAVWAFCSNLLLNLCSARCRSSLYSVCTVRLQGLLIWTGMRGHLGVYVECWHL